MPSSSYQTWLSKTRNKSHVHAASWFNNVEASNYEADLCPAPGVGKAIKIDRITVKSIDGAVAVDLTFSFAGTTSDVGGSVPFWLSALAADEGLVIEPTDVIGPENKPPRMTVNAGKKFAVVFEGTVVKVA